MQQKESLYAKMVEKTDKMAQELYHRGQVNEVLFLNFVIFVFHLIDHCHNLSSFHKQTIDFLTQFSVTTANELVDSWVLLWQQLFMKYRDGLVVTPPPSPSECNHNGAMGGVVPKVTEVNNKKFPNFSSFCTLFANNYNNREGTTKIFMMILLQ